MYEPLHSKSAITVLHDWLAGFGVEADGLTLKTPDGGDAFFDSSLRIPPRLETWLTDLRLLRGIPLAYLVPDARLLPIESIRAFHVDPTWCDRVIDGVLSAANIGTVDVTFTLFILSRLRQALDAVLTEMAQQQAPATPWNATNDPMSGLLIRSELVRRWPQLVVRAYRGDTPVAVLRKEAVGRDLMIAVFGGVPNRVELREPFYGQRFGIERGNRVNARKRNGQYRSSNGNPMTITVALKDRRVVDIAGLATKLGGAGSALVALTLEQLPYVQVLESGVPESKGRINCRPAIQIKPLPNNPIGDTTTFQPINQR